MDGELAHLGDEEYRRSFDKRLPPAREDYLRAFNRAVLRVARTLGADLTDIEEDMLHGHSEEVDAEFLRRYRALLPEKEGERQLTMLLRMAQGEAIRRGVDPDAEDEKTT